MRFAYFVKPHLGGTFTLFTHLRRGLAGHGIEVEWLGMIDGPEPAAALSPMDRASGLMVHANGCDNDLERAMALCAALEAGGFDGVFVNVLADRVQMNLARYLPERMLRVMIVHNITPGTYAAARALRDHVHATVGVSERCRRDLVERHGFSSLNTFAIANAAEVESIAAIARPARPEAGLRLVYLGRVEDAAKGVFWLPPILAALPETVTMTIAGDGPDLGILRERMAPFANRVRFLGGVSPAAVPTLLAAHDLLVMPSRFEGFGLTLAEAMAAGCVPVVSRIEGVTDTLVEHDVSGVLIPMGDWRAAARDIDSLARDGARLDAMSDAARERAVAGFGIERMARDYARLLETLEVDPPPIASPLPLSAWTMPRGMRDGARTRLPAPVKNWLRVVRERIHPLLQPARKIA